MKIKNSSKIIKIDGIYIFICAFALIGGYSILKSYAFKKTDSLRPGIYHLLDYRGDFQNQYKLSLSKDYQYCFKNYVTISGEDVVMIKDENQRLALKLTQMDNNTACFGVETNYENAILEIPSATTLPELLIVKNKH